MAKEPTQEIFLKDVANHEMTVVLDNGINRCLRFAGKGEHRWYLHFTLTTWPGYLCISGDMGCFVFTRLDDMFEFFRSKPRDTADASLYINTGYWAEKCEAADRRTSGLETYDGDKFRTRVEEYFNENFEGSAEDKKECWDNIRHQVLGAESEHEAHDNLRTFEDGFEFPDSWEWDLTKYTYQYIWCCYAIAWGIRQYDLTKAAINPEAKSVSA